MEGKVAVIWLTAQKVAKVVDPRTAYAMCVA
jgi:hypothetical protein